ncbi:uncharacterized protein J7T54_000539 [Emericellopsis cladophorae]|uniref:Uncharacterized protein n=1 Tax=Emericellopsis cladophorae TaxID=2686198 RepID=A0A9P9XWF7_9HYPO|nr:uncharacterized protein J7T54_000539 [Emericellopsis cladophorae]KAI6778883.1 hypothetical protein J7T54_000539 [Emericellopsis cladophorae]
MAEPDASAIDIASTAGTWVAAILAIIALVGIIGPWLALQAAHSDKSRALNAVRDQPQRYVTKGFSIGAHTTLFRRVRVPDLAPTYGTNKATVANFAKGVDFKDRLFFEFPDYKQWNTGWAMLAAAAEAYNFHRPPPRDGDEPVLMPLVRAQGGTVEVINSLSAVVSLSPEGIFSRQPDGAPHLVGGNTENYGDSDDDTASDISVPESYKTDASRRLAVQQTAAGVPVRYRLFQGHHGIWELSSSRLPEITGFTGRFRSLGHQRGKWTYQTALAYYGRHAKEIAELLGEDYAVPNGGKLLLDDISHVAWAWLSLQWHEWGYLIWKLECKYWTKIMQSSASLLLDDVYSVQVSAFLDKLVPDDDQQSSLQAIFDWDPESGYHPIKWLLNLNRRLTLRESRSVRRSWFLRRRSQHRT